MASSLEHLHNQWLGQACATKKIAWPLHLIGDQAVHALSTAFTWDGLSRHHKLNFHWQCCLGSSHAGSPVPALLHLLALQLKPSLPERPLFTHNLSFWFESRRHDGDARDRGLVDRGVLTIHRRLLDQYVLNLLPSPGIPTHLQQLVSSYWK